VVAVEQFRPLTAFPYLVRVEFLRVVQVDTTIRTITTKPEVAAVAPVALVAPEPQRSRVLVAPVKTL
jgi:hypothetical protein